MKKIFLSIFILFSIFTYSKGYIEEISTPKPIKNSDKTVFITGFPVDFETTIEGLLEEELGWKVAIAKSNGEDAFAIEAFDIRYKDFHGYSGVIRFTDLRTGKRIGYYEFSSEKFDVIITNILNYIDYISEIR